MSSNIPPTPPDRASHFCVSLALPLTIFPPHVLDSGSAMPGLNPSLAACWNRPARTTASQSRISQSGHTGLINWQNKISYEKHTSKLGLFDFEYFGGFFKKKKSFTLMKGMQSRQVCEVTCITDKGTFSLVHSDRENTNSAVSSLSDRPTLVLQLKTHMLLSHHDWHGPSTWRHTALCAFTSSTMVHLLMNGGNELRDVKPPFSVCRGVWA